MRSATAKKLALAGALCAGSAFLCKDVSAEGPMRKEENTASRIAFFVALGALYGTTYYCAGRETRKGQNDGEGAASHGTEHRKA